MWICCWLHNKLPTNRNNEVLVSTCCEQAHNNSQQVYKKSTINPQQVRNTQQVLQHVVQQSTTKSNKWSLEISQQVRRIMEDEDLKVDSNDTLIIIIIIVVVVILFLNN